MISLFDVFWRHSELRVQRHHLGVQFGRFRGFLLQLLRRGKRRKVFWIIVEGHGASQLVDRGKNFTVSNHSDQRDFRRSAINKLNTFSDIIERQRQERFGQPFDVAARELGLQNVMTSSGKRTSA